MNKHNVWDNDIKAPNYHYWNIFRFLKTADTSKKIAIFSTWLDNRTKLAGDQVANAGNLSFDFHLDGLEHDTVRFPHDPQSQYINRIDETIADSAAHTIRLHAPDLTWVYLEFPDDMGHRHGDGEAFYNAIETMDKQVGRIWDAIKYRQTHFKEDWAIYITTDHGRDSVTGKGHGGQSNRERITWMVTNDKNVNNYFRKMNPGIVDIMPTLATHLRIPIPREQKMEIDGLPLNTKLTAIDATAVLKDGKLIVGWKALERSGRIKIWLATTNQFKTGGTDEYKLVAEVPLSMETAVIEMQKMPASFYKVVIETGGYFLNRWIQR